MRLKAFRVTSPGARVSPLVLAEGEEVIELKPVRTRDFNDEKDALDLDMDLAPSALFSYVDLLNLSASCLVEEYNVREGYRLVAKAYLVKRDRDRRLVVNLLDVARGYEKRLVAATPEDARKLLPEIGKVGKRILKYFLEQP